MKSSMKRSLLIITLLALCNIAYGAETKPKPIDPNSYEYMNSQVAKFIDCQEIVLDAAGVGGKVVKKTLCFYDVTIGTEHKIMWLHLKSGQIGFVSH